MDSITELPRVGAKTASRLIEHFGSEEAAIAAMESHDILALSKVPGVGERGAITLVQEYIAFSEGVEAGSFLQTQEANRVYERLIGLLRSFAHTPRSRAKLGLNFPMPGRCTERIRYTQQLLLPFIKFTSSLQPVKLELLHARLRQVRPLTPGTGNHASREQLIIVEDEERGLELKNIGLDRFAAIIVASDPREVADIARGYSSAIVVGRRLIDLELPGSLKSEYVDNPENVLWMVPEATLDFFIANIQSIHVCLEVVEAVGGELATHAPGFTPPVSSEEVSMLERSLSAIGEDGHVVEGTSEDCDRLRSALDRLDDAVSKHFEEANGRLNEALHGSSVTISGDEIIPLLGAADDPGIRPLLSREVRDAYGEVCSNLLNGICSTLDISPMDAHPIEESLPDDVCYPLQLNQSALKRMRGELESSLHVHELGIRQSAARELSVFKPVIGELIEWVLEFDSLFAVGLFAREYGLTMPELVSEPQLDLKGGTNMFLAAGGQEVEPVSYALGVERDNLRGDKITLLSGVNSGGKTSLLDLLAQCIILGHMGFPVPADSLTLGVTDSFYYFNKSRGTLSAGAFEATLRNFAPVSRPGAKIVLADELEAITEPGASARIVAGILDSIHDEPDNLAVVVSHLAEQITEHCSWPVRVDGIEANGLDANFNLVIDRNPRYDYLARSTPELIVERLVLGSTDDDRQFYMRLKEKFNVREGSQPEQTGVKSLFRRHSHSLDGSPASRDCAYPQ